MTKTPFLDHRAIRKLAEQTPKLDAILAQREIFDAIDPITPAIVGTDAPHEAMGYFATADGRIIFRLVANQEAQDIFGVDAATTKEAFLVADRISHIGEIERAAIGAQARAVKLFAAVELLHQAAQIGAEVSRKDMIRIGSLIHDIRREDASREGEVTAMRKGAEQANRDRKWAMKQLGVA